VIEGFMNVRGGFVMSLQREGKVTFDFKIQWKGLLINCIHFFQESKGGFKKIRNNQEWCMEGRKTRDFYSKGEL